MGLPFTSKYSPVEPSGILIKLGFDPLEVPELEELPELLDGVEGFELLEELLDGSRGLGVDVLLDDCAGFEFEELFVGSEFEELFVGSEFVELFSGFSSGSEVVELSVLLDAGGVVVSMGFEVS